MKRIVIIIIVLVAIILILRSVLLSENKTKELLPRNDLQSQNNYSNPEEVNSISENYNHE